MSLEHENQKIAVFQGRAEDNFILWSTRINAYLEGKGLADIVHGERVIPKPKRNEDDSE